MCHWSLEGHDKASEGFHAPSSNEDRTLSQAKLDGPGLYTWCKSLILHSAHGTAYLSLTPGRQWHAPVTSVFSIPGTCSINITVIFLVTLNVLLIVSLKNHLHK